MSEIWPLLGMRAKTWWNAVFVSQERVGHPFVLIYLVYVTFVVFATLRVVTAVFLKDTKLGQIRSCLGMAG